MLTIPRRPGEGIVIGNSIIVTVLEVDAERVRLVIEDRDDHSRMRIVECSPTDHLRLDGELGGE